MRDSGPIVALLLFEAADCLMAVPASEVGHLEKRGRVLFPGDAENSTRPRFSVPQCDLGEYFSGRESDGPWLLWARGTRGAWLRVRRVIDVTPIAVSALTPMPTLLRGRRRSRAFLAAGVGGGDVFLFLDPARLGADALEVATLEPSSGAKSLTAGGRRPINGA